MKRHIEIQLLFLTILLSFGAFSCDTDKYLLSNLNRQPFAGDSTFFEGKIIRKDTGENIWDAKVRVGYVFTHSDSNGWYHLDIPVTADDNRNTLTPLVVSADKYITLQDFEYITPLPKSLNISLVYAAPIFENVQYENDQGRRVFHAWIKDFQGAEDVIEVFVFVQVSKIKKLSIPMKRVRVIDGYRTYWMTEPFFEDVNSNGYGPFWAQYTAIDYAGNEEVLPIKYLN